jgi:hypothetical protein
MAGKCLIWAENAVLGGFWGRLSRGVCGIKGIVPKIFDVAPKRQKDKKDKNMRLIKTDYRSTVAELTAR